MTEEAKQRKRENDRARYKRKAEEIKARQREYYASHRDQCIMSVRLSEYKKLRTKQNKRL